MRWAGYAAGIKIKYLVRISDDLENLGIDGWRILK